MYDISIKNGNQTRYMHRGGIVQTAEKLPSATIQDEINAISSLSFSIYPNNPCYDCLFPFLTTVEVYNNKKQRVDFTGRVLKITPQLDSDGMYYKNVVCENRMAYLRDSIQPYTEERQYDGDDSRNGLQEFIDLILENHNAQVTNEKKIYRGNITVNPFATSDGVYKGLNYETTWEIIINKLIGSFGGEIDLREDNGILYLDYKPEIGTTRATTIELAKNVESASRDIDPTKIVTRVIPLGAKLKKEVIDEQGNVTEVETEERLNVKSVNDDKIYLEDTTAADLYGVIYGTAIFDDVTQAANLKIKGEQYLSDNNKINISDNVTALDLSLIELDIDDFMVFDKYPYKNPVLGIDDTLKVIKKTTNIIEPYASSFTLGNSTKLLSDAIFDYETKIKDIQNEASATKTEIKNSNTDVFNYIDKRASKIEQSTNQIKAEVERTTVSKTIYEEFATTVRNILQMNEDGIAMVFETINQSIATVNGRQETNYNNILKYIRFVDGNIILGEQGNEMTLTISNNRMSFKQNGAEVAYMSNNKLYIGNAEVKSGGTLQLGNFAFVPRSDGSLSFVKVGD